jgi:hypothetical protein
MFKLLGQFLAIITLLASVLNTQCVASCLLRNPTDLAVNTSAHSCCPHERTPQKKKDSCPHLALTADQDLVETVSGLDPVVIAIALPVNFTGSVFPLPIRAALRHTSVFESSGLSPRSSTTILKV